MDVRHDSVDGMHRPNSEAQIRLHCGHLGPVVGGLGGLCLRVRVSVG